tara:strand:- start:1104 stop:1949 length:846 start_codon:yes stop_codon:yes gene_type:complete
MNELEYSVDALNVKAAFFGKRFSVYVEGEDDIIFWESLFKIAGLESIYVEEVGGYTNLTPYMEKICNEDAKIIVAADTDHLDIVGFDFEHDRIVRTFGYSIENSLYNSERISKVIRQLSKKTPPNIDEIETWKVSFADIGHELLVYAIANKLFGREVKTFTDKCSRFLKSKNSDELCVDKMKEWKDSLAESFSAEEIEEANNIVSNSTKDRWYLIRGHFLTNGVINYIKKQVRLLAGKEPLLPLDNLYAMCADLTELKNFTHQEFQAPIAQVQLARKSLNN